MAVDVLGDGQLRRRLGLIAVGQAHAGGDLHAHRVVEDVQPWYLGAPFEEHAGVEKAVETAPGGAVR